MSYEISDEDFPLEEELQDALPQPLPEHGVNTEAEMDEGIL